MPRNSFNQIMGTRHLTVVQLDGEYRIAQYGQWDGYPSGQGETVLEFLKNWDQPKFEAALRKCSFFNPKELTEFSEMVKREGIQETWPKKFPELSRDTGAEILGAIQEVGGFKLKDSIEFAKDSLFCEYAYVLDLDANTLEVYKGFNKSPLVPTDRFYGDGKPNEDGYYPIKLAKAYHLDKLPTVEQMTEDVDPKENEE